MIKRFISRFWPSMLVLAVILYATLWPDPVGARELPRIPHLDKLIHAVMMGGLVGAITFDYHRAWRDRPLKFGLMAAIFGGVVLFSAADEWLQGVLTQVRTADTVDLLADSFGALVAALTAPAAVRRVLR